MPKARLPFIRREKSRHGRLNWYFRRESGPRVRLPDDYGSKEFMLAYNEALAGNVVNPSRTPGKGTFSWLVSQYKGSREWAVLSRATQRQRDNILSRTVKAIGNEDFTDIGPGDIEARTVQPHRSSASTTEKIKRARFQLALLCC